MWDRLEEAKQYLVISARVSITHQWLNWKATKKLQVIYQQESDDKSSSALHGAQGACLGN